MSSLIRRGRGDLFDSFNQIDRLFDDWMRSFAMRRPAGFDWALSGEELIRVDEYRDGNTEVIRAELPGVDPEKDVEITVDNGVLRIKAERRVEEKTEDKGYLRHELSYGTFSRSLPLPEGVSESTIAATYQGGILEIRVPLPEKVAAPEPTKIAIATS